MDSQEKPPRLGVALIVPLALGLLSCGGSKQSPPPSPAVLPTPKPAPVAAKIQRPALAPDLLARREIPLGAKPLSLVAHDFNDDGFDDIAVVTEKPGAITILSGSKQGLMRRGTTLPIGDFPTNLAQEGNQIFVGIKSTGELLCIEIQPQGSTLTATVAWRKKPGGFPSAITVLKTKLGTRILWATRDDRILAIESDAVTEKLQLEEGARIVGIQASQDQLSFALFSQGSHEVRIFDEHETGNATERARIPMNGVPRSGTEADLDGDGDLETVFIGGDNTMIVFGLGTDAGFAMGASLRTEQLGTVPVALIPGDLDGDGREELVSLGLGNLGYSVLGDFGSEGARLLISEYAGQDPVDLALGDFNGDGKLDLVAACRDAVALSVLNGTGVVRSAKPAFFQAARVGVGANPLSTAAADLFGPGAGQLAAPDGMPEIATLDAADGMLSILANDGFGKLSLAKRLPVGPSPRGLLAVRRGTQGQAFVALSVPAGSTGQLVAFGRRDQGIGPLEVLVEGSVQMPAASEAEIACGDLNGDNLDDLILVDAAASTLYLLLGQNAADNKIHFKAKDPIALPATPRAVAVLLRPEGIRIAIAFNQELRLFDNAGRSVETISVSPSLLTGRGCSRLVAADLNGDGFDDLASLWLGPQGTSPGTVSTIILGAETKTVSNLPSGLAPADLGAADLNGDGLDELFVASQNSHLVDLWVNRGAKGLQRGLSIGVGLGPLDLCAVDLMGKGYPDLVVANAFSADVSIVYNRPLAAD